MPLPYQLPASLRYFKARLRPLAQPPVWGTAIFISVVGLVAWEHWLNPLRPDWQKNEVIEANNPAYPSLSREDSRIGADIDSLPVLLHDFGQSIAPAVPIAPNKKTQATKTKGSFEESLTQKQAISTDTQSTPTIGTGTPASPTPNLENPFLVQAQKLLQASSLESREPSLGVNPYTASSQPVAGQTSGSSQGIQLPSGTGQNQGVATISPLPPALNPPAAANLTATPTISPQAPTNALEQSLPASALPSQISPATMGLPAGTGYIAPYSVQVPSQAPRSYTNPRLNSNFGTSGLQPSQLQQRNFQEGLGPNP